MLCCGLVDHMKDMPRNPQDHGHLQHQHYSHALQEPQVDGCLDFWEKAGKEDNVARLVTEDILQQREVRYGTRRFKPAYLDLFQFLLEDLHLCSATSHTTQRQEKAQSR